MIKLTDFKRGSIRRLSKRALVWGGVLSTIAFFGLISTQYFWISNALRLSRYQFDHRLTLCLNEISKDINGRLSFYNGCTHTSCAKHKAHFRTITDVLDDQDIKAIIEKKISAYDLDPNYRFILSTKKDNTRSTADGIFSSPLALKPHETCLDFKKENFYLKLYFPNKNAFLLGRMMFWIVLSVVFILIMVVMFFCIMYATLSQKKLNQIKDDFIDNITHEFKTPISTIVLASGNLERITAATPLEKVKKYGEIIGEEANRLKTQTEYILEIAKMDLGRRGHAAYKAISLNSMVEEYVSSFERRVHEKPVAVRCHLDDSARYIYADPFLIRVMLSNIFENAVKYSFDEVCITVRTFDIDNEVTLEIQDDGVGIAKEDLKYIFEKFFRCHTGDRHDVKGFGLGLYYVNQIVKEHNGTIRLESEKGAGTTFVITFPYLRG
jgi:two-component system, OmpR family, phosphate regulon sensor histidine kinase PhoR